MLTSSKKIYFLRAKINSERGKTTTEVKRDEVK